MNRVFVQSPVHDLAWYMSSALDGIFTVPHAMLANSCAQLSAHGAPLPPPMSLLVWNPLLLFMACFL